jgi:hypothetical protein
VDRPGQLEVQLDDVRAYPHDLLEPRVARAGIVDRDSRTALPQVGQRRGEQAVPHVDLVLGQLDDHVGEVLWEGSLDGVGGKRRGTDVDG